MIALRAGDTILRRLAYSRTLCDNAGNVTSRRLADLMVKRWFDELGATVWGCDCLDKIENSQGGIQEGVTPNDT